jgi:hypothetical protein
MAITLPAVLSSPTLAIPRAVRTPATLDLHLSAFVPLHSGRHVLRLIGLVSWTVVSGLHPGLVAMPAEPLRVSYEKQIWPLLTKYCFDCHDDISRKGDLSLESLAASPSLGDPQFWLSVLKKTRANLMPPYEEDQPEPAEMAHLQDWIKTAVFQSDPHHPDPGRVTLIPSWNSRSMIRARALITSGRF